MPHADKFALTLFLYCLVVEIIMIYLTVSRSLSYRWFAETKDLYDTFSVKRLGLFLEWLHSIGDNNDTATYFLLFESMHGDVIKWKHFPRHCPLMPRRNGHPLADDMVKCNSLNRSISILFHISLNWEYLSNGSDHGLAPNRPQAIILINRGLVRWSVHEFRKTLCFISSENEARIWLALYRVLFRNFAYDSHKCLTWCGLCHPYTSFSLHKHWGNHTIPQCWWRNAQEQR